MPRNKSDVERRTDSWLFRVANHRHSTLLVVLYTAAVWVSAAVTAYLLLRSVA